MLETFKARLKAKYPGVNLSQKRIDAIADRLHKKFPDLTEEADHDAKLDELNELMPFSDIAKEDDRLRTLEAKNKPTPQPQPNNPNNPAPNPPDDDTPAWATALLQKVESLEKEKVQQTLFSKLKEKAKEKKIPDILLEGVTIDKEEDLDSVLSSVETKLTVLKQELTNQGLMNQTKPVSGSPVLPVENVDADIKAWAEKNKDSSTT